VYRETFAKNVDIWMRLQLTFTTAILLLERRSLREAYAAIVGPNVEVPESSTLICQNHAPLVQDLTLLNTLLIIARNMLALKEVAQDICATVQLDKQILKLIVLCISVTSKGYDGENVDAISREKLNEVTELCKFLEYPSSLIFRLT
jgi:palmitoyltransferase